MTNETPEPPALQVDMSNVRSSHSYGNIVARGVWSVVWLLLFRPTGRKAHRWRRFLLRLFGAKLGRRARIYPSCRVWAPWNLTMGDYACLGDFVDCYCVAPITIGAHATVSQYSYLCAATHDYRLSTMPLVTKPIIIEDQVWVCADAFVAPGIRIGQGAVVGARSTVTRHVRPWTVVAGNPAKLVRQRELIG